MDHLILRERDTTANGTLDERLYALHDTNFNVTALVNPSGSILERYTYTAYGTVEVRTSAFQPTGNSSAYAWPYTYTARRLDAETGLMYYRNRMYHTKLARFVSRDPIIDANLYRYCVNKPIMYVDSFGLKETVRCVEWTRCSTTLGYSYDEIGGLECIFDRFAAGSSLNARVAQILGSLGISCAAQFAAMLKSGKVAGRLARAGIMLNILLITKMLYDFAKAGEWCRAEVCTRTVAKVEVRYERHWANPMGLLFGREYTCMECPEGSEEATLNEGDTATRAPDPVVPLPDAAPGDVFIWPRGPKGE